MQGTNEIADIVSGYFMNDERSGELDVRESIYVISDQEADRAKYRDIIEIAGHRVTNAVDLAQAAAGLETQVNLSAILAQIDTAPPEWIKHLNIVEANCMRRDIPLILVVPIAVMDQVMDEISYHNVEHIIIADETASQQTDLAAEIIISLPRRMTRTRPDVYQSRDEIDVRDLKKISADVERIAQALNQLSSQDTGMIGYAASKNNFVEPGLDSIVSDAPAHFKSQDNADLKPLGYRAHNNPGDKIAANNQSLTSTAPSTITGNQVRNLIKARRLREQYFDAELFADPAWDMLLDLMAAQLENKRVSVSSLCIAASVPPTTALRWIKTMTEEKIFERKADTHDGRRIFIELSDQTTAAMIGFFGMIRRQGGMLV